jgi:hypothetical protein
MSAALQPRSNHLQHQGGAYTVFAFIEVPGSWVRSDNQQLLDIVCCILLLRNIIYTTAARCSVFVACSELWGWLRSQPSLTAGAAQLCCRQRALQDAVLEM